MTNIEHLTIEAADPGAAAVLYKTAFGLDDLIRVRQAEGETSGFRAFTVSLLTRQPADVDALVDAALAAGATAVKPVTQSFWGYSGVVQAPDGSIWKAASSSKKNTAPPSKHVEQVVLLLGCEDVAASKRFYVGQGLTVDRSFGRKYVEFAARPDGITLGLLSRRALAKDAGVPPEGTGSHRIAVGSDAGAFTDPDGFVWEPSS